MFCIDALHCNSIGRFLNHSKMESNLKVRVEKETLSSSPRLFFVATRNIAAGEELLYDYNETDPAILNDLPFLKM